MAVTHMLRLLLLWNYLHTGGDASKKCYFEMHFSACNMKCYSPTADEILQAVKNMNISGVKKMWMSGKNITELPEEAFHSVKLSGMKQLVLTDNSISELPDNIFKSPYLVNMERLYLALNKITKLKSNQFISLQKLKYLDASRNKIKVIEPGAFTSNPVGLSEINLGNNEITMLRDDLFNGVPFRNLKEINLENNHILQLPKCIFASNMFPNLTFLNLDRNSISRIPSLPNFNLPSLRYLSLKHNKVTSISPYMFNSSKWISLEFLDLTGNRISNIPSNLFSSKSLQHLKSIDFSKNSLKGLSEGLLNNPVLTSLANINLARNEIEFLQEGILNYGHLRKLWHLRLNNNKIKTLPRKFLQNPVLFKSLELLDISNNEIHVIPSGFFQNLQSLIILRMKNNSIKHLAANMFPNTFDNLLRLDLSYNEISSIKYITSLFLYNMGQLDVRFNKIKVQVTDFITSKPGSEITKSLGKDPTININLEFNEIDSFEMFDKSRNTDAFYQAAVLDKSRFRIQGNNIFSVYSLVRATLGIKLNNIDKSNLQNVSDPQNLVRLHALIKTFPYNYSCDCEMPNYLKLQDTNAFISGVAHVKKNASFFVGKNDFNHLLCGSPQHLSGKLLSEIKKSDLQCQNTNCTNVSQCVCTNTPSNNTLRINCTGIGITYIPHILTSPYLEAYLGFNKITTLSGLKTVEDLYLLDLSYNLVQYLPLVFLACHPKIQYLNLKGNRLITLPAITAWKNMNNLRLLEFSGNKFGCDCSGSELQKTLLFLNNRAQPNSTRVLDIGLIKCDTPSGLRNKVIYSLPESDFGCPFVNLTLILTLTLTLLLTFVIVIFIGYLCRYYIRLCLFVHCGCRFFYDYKDEETKYDVFISYSSLDSDWVEERLVNPLEGLDPPYNLCLHERDFLVGIPICDNITRAIEGSKCTLVVVSRNWLESDWCQFEFRVAHCLAIVEKQTRLLVILKDQVPDAEIEGDLKLYMKTFTYLDSANLLFWPRLLNDLPAPYVGKYDKRLKERADIAVNRPIELI